MKKINYRELIVYTLGMIILAIGLTLSTKLSLGTSALMALPHAISEIYQLNFGNVTLFYYIVLIIIQVIIHIIMKKYKNIIGDLLQLLISIIFTRLINLLNTLIPTFNSLNNVFSSIYMRIIIYLLAIILIGIGAALSIKTKYPPNPADGLIKTITEISKKNLGTIKNFTDITLVTITCIFSYIKCNKIIGVGIGTIMAMLGVGRVIYYFNKTIGKKIDNYIK